MLTNAKKTMLAVAAAATLATGTITAPNTAEARCVGCAVGAGIIGGLALGAIAAGAAGAYGPYYGPPPPNAYYGPGPYYGPVCRIRRERFWDGWAWRVRPVRVCF
jgi:hypothetical protein